MPRIKHHQTIRSLLSWIPGGVVCLMALIGLSSTIIGTIDGARDKMDSNNRAEAERKTSVAVQLHPCKGNESDQCLGASFLQVYRAPQAETVAPPSTGTHVPSTHNPGLAATSADQPALNAHTVPQIPSQSITGTTAASPNALPATQPNTFASALPASPKELMGTVKDISGPSIALVTSSGRQATITTPEHTIEAFNESPAATTGSKFITPGAMVHVEYVAPAQHSELNILPSQIKSLRLVLDTKPGEMSSTGASVPTPENAAPANAQSLQNNSVR